MLKICHADTYALHCITNLDHQLIMSHVECGACSIRHYAGAWEHGLYWRELKLKAYSVYALFTRVKVYMCCAERALRKELTIAVCS